MSTAPHVPVLRPNLQRAATLLEGGHLRGIYYCSRAVQTVLWASPNQPFYYMRVQSLSMAESGSHQTLELPTS